jgi:alkanesulfonate monooxygenase SsuD/methylene tetrahydromethanopterin reductase-like flavin-dependent oxidoreductase (luciferase family)
MTALWQGEASFAGAHWQVPDVYVEPTPAQAPRPPIWIGGNGEAAIRRAARVGDGWHPARLSPEEFAAGRRSLEAAVRAEGRDPADVEPSLTALLRFTEEPVDEARLRELVGAPEQVAGLLRRYAEAGVGTLVVALDPHEPLEARAAAVEQLARLAAV